MDSELKSVHSLADPIKGWLTDLEGELLYRLAKNCTGRGVIVEIGSHKGKSTVWLAKGSQAGNRVPVYAIDPHTGSPEHSGQDGQLNTLPAFKTNIEQAGAADTVIPLTQTSSQAAAVFDKPVELLFIDGSHEYGAIRNDFDLWFPKLIDGGTIALHDTVHSPGPALVARQSVYKSRQFAGARFVHSTTYASKTAQNNPSQQLKNRLWLAMLGFYGLTSKLPIPSGIKRLGGNLLRGL